MTPEQRLRAAIERLEQLDRDATPGPWEFRSGTPKMSGEVWTMRTQGVAGIRMGVTEYQHGTANAELITALRGCVPEILAILRRALDKPMPFLDYPYDPLALSLAVRVLEGAGT